MFLAGLLNPDLDAFGSMYHRWRYNHPLADLLPNPFPFELLLQKDIGGKTDIDIQISTHAVAWLQT
jgi:hypothetical protein